MAYRYDYKALNAASKTNNNFRALGDVAGTQAFSDNAVGILERAGLSSTDKEADGTTNIMQKYITKAVAGEPSTVGALQTLAGYTEAQTAEDRKDTWGGSDDTIGKSWLEKIVSGDLDTENIKTEDLYTKGFVRDADAEGLGYWDKQHQAGASIQDIAKHFLQSEEATYRTGYHENYGRDADQTGLDYWLEENTAEQAHEQADVLANFNRILQHTGDAYEQKETSVRNLLSSELGLHSSDAQRNADASLDLDGDGKADVFTDARESDVFRMMASGDLGKSEVDDKVKMQLAAKFMGDYGGGVDSTTATKIHRILASHEMGETDSEGKWKSNATTLAKTAGDYTPSITKTYHDDGTLASETDTNIWELLKSATQNYDEKVIPEEEDPPLKKKDPVIVTGTGKPKVTVGDGDGSITTTTEEVDVLTGVTSDVEDTSSYGASKAAFDNSAAGIDAPLQDMMIRNTATAKVGGSAEGVRLKRSKKFKTGESALGTKQLGRQLQIQSLNI